MMDNKMYPHKDNRHKHFSFEESDDNDQYIILDYSEKEENKKLYDLLGEYYDLQSSFYMRITKCCFLF